MDYELAEFVGILLGDGSLGVYTSRANNKVKTRYRIKITPNPIKDREYSAYVARLFIAIFNQIPKVRKRKEANAVDVYMLGSTPLRFLLGQGMVLAPKWGRAVGIIGFSNQRNIKIADSFLARKLPGAAR